MPHLGFADVCDFLDYLPMLSISDMINYSVAMPEHKPRILKELEARAAAGKEYAYVETIRLILIETIVSSKRLGNEASFFAQLKLRPYLGGSVTMATLEAGFPEVLERKAVMAWYAEPFYDQAVRALTEITCAMCYQRVKTMTLPLFSFLNPDRSRNSHETILETFELDDDDENEERVCFRCMEKVLA